jgi:hypothetical protein
MTATIFYFSLIIDLSALSTRVSAYVLVCSRVLADIGLFLVALAYFVVAFSCAISALEQHIDDFAGIHKSAMSLVEVTLGMYSGESYSALSDEPALLATVTLYIVVTVVFLLNLLIAQLNCSYVSTFRDMLGFARLNRCKIVINQMSTVGHHRWGQFVTSLRLDERLEFNEGDIGLAGGLQVLEPSSANVTTVDSIRRFGGSTSANVQWPAEDLIGEDVDERFDRLEKLIEKTMKRATSGRGHQSGGGSSFLGTSSGIGTGTGTGQSNSSQSHGSGKEDDTSD